MHGQVLANVRSGSNADFLAQGLRELAQSILTLLTLA